MTFFTQNTMFFKDPWREAGGEGMFFEGVTLMNQVVQDVTAPAVFEISGFVKWFDVGRGYGFIIPDNGLPDVLIHSRCLERNGYDMVLEEGTRVVCEAEPGLKGLRARRIFSIDISTASSKIHVIVEPESDWTEVTVKWFDRQCGYGFVTEGQGTPDIFVHMETLRRGQVGELFPDQKLLVRHGRGPKGPEVKCPAARSDQAA